MSPFSARLADASELEAVTDMCFRAFADEAVMAWAVPEPVARRAFMDHTLGPSLGAAVDAGDVILACTVGGEAIAASIWVPRYSDEDPDPARPTRGVDPVSGRVATLHAMTHERRPEAAHLHLSAMATLPGHRGRGAGATMMSAGLDRARGLELPVYLEASTPDNRRLYRRCGFSDHGGPIRLPDHGPALQPMWRDRG